MILDLFDINLIGLRTTKLHACINKLQYQGIIIPMKSSNLLKFAMTKPVIYGNQLEALEGYFRHLSLQTEGQDL